jgi:outer membrane protein OmpA-like peptidoglycan-associated protein
MLLFSCAVAPVQPDRDRPAEFEAAISYLADSLLAQMRSGQDLLAPLQDSTRIVMDPFADANSRELPGISREIEKIIIASAEKNFIKISVSRITSETLRNADYVMNGVIRQEECQTQGNSQTCYLISAALVNLKSGKIAARSDVRTTGNHLNYRSEPMSEDSPMYLKDRPMESSVKIAAGKVGDTADRAYYNALESLAMLAEAETAYGKADYQTALDLLTKASEHPEGQLMKTYSGLYSTYRRLGRMDMAEDAFAKLLAAGVEKHKTLTVKFLFDVNSVSFWKDPDLQEQYDMWLRQIGKYFKNSVFCLQIIGHCSRTGTERYNDSLSLDRARRIQKLLNPEFPEVSERSVCIGRGFKENIKGTGTDDEHDAIDRRVEFVVTDCAPR